MKYPKNYVLFNGTSKFDEGGRDIYDEEGKYTKSENILKPNQGLDPFLERQRKGWKSINQSSYQLDKEFGIVPMPGIISADIKALNRGSIKKATINFQSKLYTFPKNPP